MRFYCPSCGRQATERETNSERARTASNKPGFSGEIYCVDCAELLDENGLFPEERLRLGLPV
jgi:hypothetical protein